MEHQPKNVGILHQSGHSAKTFWNKLIDEYCYLGITLHFSGTFKRAQKIIYGKALHVYHSIFKSFSNVENVPIKLMLELFSSIVTPLVQYYYMVAKCGVRWAE